MYPLDTTCATAGGGNPPFTCTGSTVYDTNAAEHKIAAMTQAEATAVCCKPASVVRYLGLVGYFGGTAGYAVFASTSSVLTWQNNCGSSSSKACGVELTELAIENGLLQLGMQAAIPERYNLFETLL